MVTPIDLCRLNSRPEFGLLSGRLSITHAIATCAATIGGVSVRVEQVFSTRMNFTREYAGDYVVGTEEIDCAAARVRQRTMSIYRLGEVQEVTHLPVHDAKQRWLDAPPGSIGEAISTSCAPSRRGHAGRSDARRDRNTYALRMRSK